MPLYRDKLTGKVINFDHEPDEAELTARFGGQPSAAPQAPPAAPAPGASAQAGPPPHSLGERLATDVGAPMAGFAAGGALGGKPGAVLGATLGTGMGDLYNTIKDYGQNPFGPINTDTSKLGPNAPPSMYDEFKRLLTSGGAAAGGAYVLPAVTGALPGPVPIKSVLVNSGLGSLAGQTFGHPGIGAAVGGVLGGYNALSGMLRGAGNLSEALTTPRFGGAAPAEASGLSAAEQAGLVKQGYSPEMQAKISQAGASKPPLRPGAAPQEEPGLVSRAMGGLRNAASSISDYFGGGTPEAPPAPPSPPRPGLQLTKTPGDIAERVGATGQPVSTLQDLSRNPEMRWSADIEAAPQRTPSLTQTAPTDPKMPWDEHMARSAPKRASSGGQSFGGVEVSSALDGLKDAAPSSSVTGDAAPPAGVFDEALQRWIAAGGTPEGYAAARGRLQP